ncbi:alginate O-acetyltransferase AlgX-related protein [Amycolatopsis lurida]
MSRRPQQLPAVHEAWLPREHALYRPRHSGRQRTALICALAFFVTPTLLWVFGARPAEIENHSLKSFPSFSDGWGLVTDLPEWATDQLIFRSGAIQAADGISRALFGESAPLDQGGAPKSGPLPGSPPPPAGEQPPVGPGGPTNGDAGFRQVVEGSDGWLYYGYDAEAKCSPTRTIGETAGQLAKLRHAVESSGRQFVLVVAPDKTTMVPQHLPSSYPGKDCVTSATPELWRRMVGEAGAIDLQPYLHDAQRKMNRPIYPPNDSHWSDEGAIVLSRQVAEAIRPGVTRLWQTPVAGPYTIDADLPPLLGKRAPKTNTKFELRPDGVDDRAGESVESMEQPQRSTQRPLPGMITKKTLLYGDSFIKVSSRYLSAAFSDVTMLAYHNQRNDTASAVKAFADSEVVVLEVVERGVAAGNLPFLQDGFIESVRTQLAARPIR